MPRGWPNERENEQTAHLSVTSTAASCAVRGEAETRTQTPDERQSMQRMHEARALRYCVWCGMYVEGQENYGICGVCCRRGHYDCGRECDGCDRWFCHHHWGRMAATRKCSEVPKQTRPSLWQ